MEVLLKSCDADSLAPVLKDLGVETVEDIAICEPSDLCTDLDIENAKAVELIEKAKEAVLFEKRKSAVQSSWKAVEDALSVDATKLFYKHLFEEYPSVIPLFEHADMEAQAEKLYKTVGLAVKFLEDVDALIPVLEEMGERHALEWKCEREHYDAVGECLIWTLKTGLGDAWTPEVADAWTWVYGVIGKTMAEAGEKVLFERRKKAVTDTWKAVEDALAVDATKLFYKHLFEEYPSVIPLFEHADMEAQAEKLYKTVGLAIKFLEDVDALIPVLEEMGERHALEWKCEREHYDAVGKCLIWTLQTGLGDAWTPEVADAWTWVYGVIGKTMADAGEKALSEERKS